MGVVRCVEETDTISLPLPHRARAHRFSHRDTVALRRRVSEATAGEPGMDLDTWLDFMGLARFKNSTVTGRLYDTCQSSGGGGSGGGAGAPATFADVLAARVILDPGSYAEKALFAFFLSNLDDDEARLPSVPYNTLTLPTKAPA